MHTTEAEERTAEEWEGSRAGDRVRCVKGKYEGWEGWLVEVHKRMVMFTPCYRHDKMQKQQCVPKESIELEREEVVAVSKVMDEIITKLEGLGRESVTRADWIELCDRVERLLF